MFRYPARFTALKILPKGDEKMSDYIEIWGVTPASSFPKCSSHCPSNQICETDKLCIPRQKPPMECILQVSVNLSLCSHKIICTPIGKKLVIEGVKHIKIIYVAEKSCQSVHCAHFDVPFYMFILLKDIPYEVIDVCTAIEDIQVHQLDCRCFSLSTIIFGCPKFKKDKKHCSHHIYNEIDCCDEDFENKSLQKDCEDCESPHDKTCWYPSKCYSDVNLKTKVDCKVDVECKSKKTNISNDCDGSYQTCKYCPNRNKCTYYK